LDPADGSSALLPKFGKTGTGIRKLKKEDYIL
jgi:hypothetical protein